MVPATLGAIPPPPARFASFLKFSGFQGRSSQVTDTSKISGRNKELRLRLHRQSALPFVSIAISHFKPRQAQGWRANSFRFFDLCTVTADQCLSYGRGINRFPQGRWRATHTVTYALFHFLCLFIDPHLWPPCGAAPPVPTAAAAAACFLLRQ